jgi:hypothetical protein
LPRVRKVLGVLRGVHPANLLDVGSGRGAFLWPQHLRLYDAHSLEQHLRLYDAHSLDCLLRDGGARRVTIEYVLNHMIAVARV